MMDMRQRLLPLYSFHMWGSVSVNLKNTNLDFIALDFVIVPIKLKPSGNILLIKSFNEFEASMSIVQWLRRLLL